MEKQMLQILKFTMQKLKNGFDLDGKFILEQVFLTIYIKNYNLRLWDNIR